MNAARILYVEDKSDHVDLVTGALQAQLPGTLIEHTQRMHEALLCLANRPYDLVLLSSHLDDEPVIHDIHSVIAASSGAPVVILAGSGDERSAASAVRHGATEYLIKTRESLEILPFLVQRLLKKRKPPEALSDSREPLLPSGVNQLIDEINQVSRRIHTVQDRQSDNPEWLELRAEVQRLKEFAQQLSETWKTSKTKS